MSKSAMDRYVIDGAVSAWERSLFTPLKFTSCRTTSKSRILCTNPCILAKSAAQPFPETFIQVPSL